jgi:hypothetical protein
MGVCNWLHQKLSEPLGQHSAGLLTGWKYCHGLWLQVTGTLLSVLSSSPILPYSSFLSASLLIPLLLAAVLSEQPGRWAGEGWVMMGTPLALRI